MKKLPLFLFFVAVVYTNYAQSIIVQPYLQDASSTKIKVMWETDGGSDHQISWGTTAGNLDQSVAATSNASSGANLIHAATISGLTANTRYHYQVNSGATSSAVFDFITPPLKSANQSFNLVAMSDMQKDGSNPTIFDEVVHDGVIDYFEEEFGNDLPTDLGLVLIPGDLVPSGNSYSQWQNDFFSPAHPLFSRVPVYPVLGNHENNSGFYFQYFELPKNGSVGYEEHWWYKDYSNVRIIGLNSNSGYRIQEQLDWLETTLDDACADADIDFVFTQLHHPHLSELWTPGETDYTGEVIQLMETFTTDCSKPSIHFFGHTHGYSRGQSQDHEHLWVNVATAGGAIDNWGEFPNADYAEFNTSIDEYGFVVVNVTAGADPEFTLRRLSRGDQNTTLDNVEQDVITMKKSDNAPVRPMGLFPNGVDVSPDCITLTASPFTDPGNFHQASQWQIATDCTDFGNPIIDSWKQHENWYNEVDTQAGDDLTDEEIGGLEANSNYCWRVRYRDEHLKWSEWSIATAFSTGDTEFTANLVLNGGGEAGIDNWTIETGIIESLDPGECNGVNPYAGDKYLAVGGLCDGNETDFSEVYQAIDVSSMSSYIDGGDAEAWFGGYLSDYSGSDQPTMQLEYLDGANTLLQSSTVLTVQSPTWTKLEARELMPINTRSIKVVLTGTRNAGEDNDSYFEELFFRVDTIPGDNCADLPLPVELIAFKGQCKEGRALLNWEVEAEVNLQTYWIVRSYDGLEWKRVGQEIPTDLTELRRKRYVHFNTENIVGKTVYYRLGMQDFDGALVYSPSIVLEGDCSTVPFSFEVYPNPVLGTQNQLTISVHTDGSMATFELINAFGQRIKAMEFALTGGENDLTFPLTDLENGVYVLRLLETGTSQVVILNGD